MNRFYQSAGSILQGSFFSALSTCGSVCMYCLFGCGGTGGTRPADTSFEKNVDDRDDASILLTPEEIEGILRAELKYREGAGSFGGHGQGNEHGKDVLALAKKLCAEKRFADAKRVLETALRLDPGKVEERLYLIDLLLQQGMRAQADRHIDSLPAVEDDNAAVVDRALLLERAGRFREAANLIYEFLGSTPPSDAALISALAAAECALGRPEAAFVLQGRDVSETDAKRECEARIREAGMGEMQRAHD